MKSGFLAVGRCDPAKGLQRRKIEYGHRIVPPVARVALAEILCESDAVDSRRVRDFTEQTSIRRVDDLNPRRAADEESMSGTVEGQVVPATITLQWHRMDEAVLRS